ncbi:hypothetical protein FHS59_004121 [Algoriphagus iocasae]|uniref:Uncharacterized protein n=1 Tax=Algoriphagus iocasae TaxID=1836499 RepID=A0A841N0N0_9BACT|nr:hypothetical protein [Algoriphagus iocasae]
MTNIVIEAISFFCNESNSPSRKIGTGFKGECLSRYFNPENNAIQEHRVSGARVRYKGEVTQTRNSLIFLITSPIPYSCRDTHHLLILDS